MQPHKFNMLFWLKVGLVLTAHLATEIVLGDEHGDTLLILSKFTAIIAITIFIYWRAVQKAWKPGGLTTVLALLFMWGPVLVEPFWRMTFQVGHAFELQLLIGFRNVALLSFIYSQHERFERISLVTSLFAILFCISSCSDQSLIWICGIYLILGINWLCLRYWSALRTETIVGNHHRAPWGLISVVVLLLLGAVITVSMPSSLKTRMVEGIFPSSGGTGDYDEFARSGVGNGDALVAATKEAMTFAPIEEAPFVESKDPSFYDVFQDTYGKPKPPKKTERAISLSAELFKQNHQRMAKAKKSSKTFSLDRMPNKKSKRRHLEDTESNALFHLLGPVSAHLRHTTYDLFDGREWFEEEPSKDQFRLINTRTIGEKPWITWHERPSPMFETFKIHHALRILKIDTNRILAPANLCGVHIDKCDRPDMFHWAQEDVLAMSRSRLPTMTVMHLVSTLVDPSDLEFHTGKLSYGIEEHRSLPVGHGMPAIKRIAQEWTKGAKTDWKRVCAIRDRLKENYIHDPNFVVPDDCENSVLWFLQDSKRGPDYLFASATVMLCRSLGIGCRAASGLYASPENFDFSKQQTSVYSSDAHWWAEVYLGAGLWVTVESTPGYETTPPPRGLLATIWNWCQVAMKTSIVYWPVTLSFLVLAGFLIRFQNQLLARWLTWKWGFRYWTPCQTVAGVRVMLLETARLFDRKLSLARTPRPDFETFSSYLAKGTLLGEQNNLAPSDLQQLSEAFDWACYSSCEKFDSKESMRELHQLCKRLVDTTHIEFRKKEKNRSQMTEGLL